MPELPEVETLRLDLARVVIGKRVGTLRVVDPRIVRRQVDAELGSCLAGRRILGVARRGAHLLFQFDGEKLLVVYLGANGRIRRQRTTAPIEPGTEAIVTFTTGGDLRFTDLSNVGELFMTDVRELDGIAELLPAAIDPLIDPLTWQAWGAHLQDRRMPLRPLLTDARFLAGVGDVYADEILWASGLRHDRRSQTLTAQEVRRLYRAAREIIQEATRLRGSSVGERPFHDLNGNVGGYGGQLGVYDRAGQPCRRCRTPITRRALPAGGDTYSCPRCQS